MSEGKWLFADVAHPYSRVGKLELVVDISHLYRMVWGDEGFVESLPNEVGKGALRTPQVGCQVPTWSIKISAPVRYVVRSFNRSTWEAEASGSLFV